MYQFTYNPDLTLCIHVLVIQLHEHSRHGRVKVAHGTQLLVSLYVHWYTGNPPVSR